MTNDMNIIAQFIWTIRDVFDVVGLIIVVSVLLALWIWRKMDERAYKIADKQRRKMAEAATAKPKEAQP